MASKFTNAMIVGIVAGILLLIAGITGAATFETIEAFVTEHVFDNLIISYIFAILIFIASLGGISVIIGSILIGREKLGTGKFLILLGVGIGIIGLIFELIVAVMENSLALTGYLSIGGIGVILSIIARRMAKKE